MMSFTEALNEIFNCSARVTRRVWRNPKIYCSTVMQMLCITGVNADGQPHPWSVTDEDYYATDWEVVQ